MAPYHAEAAQRAKRLWLRLFFVVQSSRSVLREPVRQVSGEPKLDWLTMRGWHSLDLYQLCGYGPFAYVRRVGKRWVAEKLPFNASGLRKPVMEI